MLLSGRPSVWHLASCAPAPPASRCVPCTSCLAWSHRTRLAPHVPHASRACPYAPLASLRAPLHHAPRTVVSDPPCAVCASCHVHPPMPHTIHTPRSALPVSRASCHTPPLPRAALPSAHVNLHWAVASR
jgi:hypothetical protein